MTMNTDREPILASWKISKVLEHYPQLLDVLVDLTPAFARLRNPVLRRVQSRLVTVQQAAGIAGLDPREVVRTLNQAIGITASDEVELDVDQPAWDRPRWVASAPDGDDLYIERSDEARPAWVDTAPVVRELDVRDMFAHGQEPFLFITGAAREVRVGEAMALLTSFEPLPLYDALAKLGFSHWGEPIDDDVWRVLFYRDRETGPHATIGIRDVDWDAPATAEVTIDVRELVPPEPMIRVLRALEALPEGGRLLVHHVRRPIHLYDRLDEMGYAHDTREMGPDRVDVLIQKPGRRA